MTGDTDLIEIVRQSIAELKDRGTIYPTGAEIGARASSIASAHGINLKQHFKLLQTSLARIVEQIPDVRIERRAGTDFYIRPADDSGAPPFIDREQRSNDAQLRLRNDVFTAFTFYGSSLLYYDEISGTFSESRPESGRIIQVPRPSVTDLIELRKAFIETLEDEDEKSGLLAALRDVNPLHTFSASMTTKSLKAKWNIFVLKYALEAARRWADGAGFPFRDEWVVKPSHADKPKTMRAILLEIANHMTDDQLRLLVVPLGAVQKLLQRRL